MAFDLHTHSVISDGTDTPTQLVQAAADAGLAGVALTDHDTVAGWDEAREAAERVGIELVEGIEISTRCDRRSIHLLAYGCDPANEVLAERLARVRSSRSTRAQRMVDLIGVDYPITWPQVRELAMSEATIGRPHIADALVATGIVPNRAEAFASILRAGGPYYLPHDAPTLVEAIELVAGAGGVSVIAHGGAAARGNYASDDDIREAVAAGLAGLEVRHRDNDPAERERLSTLAANYDLVVTGGSDYHGAGKPNRIGENSTPDPDVRALLARAR